MRNFYHLSYPQIISTQPKILATEFRPLHSLTRSNRREKGMGRIQNKGGNEVYNR